jgi:hypothetical protein
VTDAELGQRALACASVLSFDAERCLTTAGAFGRGRANRHPGNAMETGVCSTRRTPATTDAFSRRSPGKSHGNERGQPAARHSPRRDSLNLPETARPWALRATRRRPPEGLGSPVTPEVAGSSPVAPAFDTPPHASALRGLIGGRTVAPAFDTPPSRRGVQVVHRPEVAHERLAGSDHDDATVVLPDAVEQGGCLVR